MPVPEPAPLSPWLSLALLVAVLALARTLAWLGWRLAATRVPPLWRALGRTPGLAPLELRLSRRWPRVVDWARARMTTGRFTGLPLTLAALLAIYLAALAAGLVEDLLESDELGRWDRRVNVALSALRNERFVDGFHWLTGLADVNALTGLVVVALALFWAFRRRPYFWGLAVTVALSTCVTWSGKYLIGRDRPDVLTFAEAATPSFPSGHTTGAMAVYGFLAYAIARELIGTRERFEVVYWAAAAIALIAFSRMVLSLHYFSDIAAGLLVGGFGVIAGICLSEIRLEREAGHR